VHVGKKLGRAALLPVKGFRSKSLVACDDLELGTWNLELNLCEPSRAGDLMSPFDGVRSVRRLTATQHVLKYAIVGQA